MKPFQFYQLSVLDHIMNDREEELMINATKMAKDYDQNSIEDFLSNEKENQTQAFINALRKDETLSSENILQTNENGDTLMHRSLAMKFAFYLDPFGGMNAIADLPDEQMKELRQKFNETFNVEL